MFSSNTSAVSADAVFVEDVMSTTLYTGNGTSQTITNGIDLSTKGGLVWVKNRSSAYTHVLVDTVRGTDKVLCSNNANGEQTGDPGFVTQFNTNGFAIGDQARVNLSSSNFVSWTFRKQPKFFDVVTYTGNGSTQAISHNLGSVPGCIIVKNITSATIWSVWHRSVNSGAAYGVLNLTDAFYTDSGGTAVVWGNNTSYVAPTSTQFTVGSNSRVNTNGDQYVAYLFAHDAGGFGLSGTDNVISCGLTAANGSGNFSVTLGYEPQWVLMKSTGSGIWSIVDNMRGATASSGYTSSQRLQPQSSAAEDQLDNPYGIGFNATGFTGNLATFSNDFIYIAIRRGPMKTPTTGTSVFAPVYATSASSPYSVTTNFPVDLVISTNTTSTSSGRDTNDRLRGGTTTSFNTLFTNSTAAESTSSGSQGLGFQSNTSIIDNGYWAGFGLNVIYWNFRRAPGFFDVVCYTGTGANRTVSHNLGVVPELMIVKNRTQVTDWAVYSSAVGNTKYLILNENVAPVTATNRWNNTTPTASVFTVGTSDPTNASGSNIVAYLFASCPGVSKVFSFTGNGSSQTINCGFTGGSRLVLIKRTDSTGNWVIFDSARGIVAGNDPALYLNSTAAEVTGVDAIDTDSTGFIVNQETTFNLNVNNATYIGLAIS